MKKLFRKIFGKEEVKEEVEQLTPRQRMVRDEWNFAADNFCFPKNIDTRKQFDGMFNTLKFLEYPSSSFNNTKLRRIFNVTTCETSFTDDGKEYINYYNGTRIRFNIRVNGEIIGYINFEKDGEKVIKVHEYLVGSMSHFHYYCNYIKGVRDNIRDKIGEMEMKKKEKAFSSMLKDNLC